MSERVFKSLLILFLVVGVFSAYFLETRRHVVQVDTVSVERWLNSKLQAEEEHIVDELIEFAGKRTTDRALRKQSLLRHFGEFRQIDAQTSALWALSRNSKKVSSAFQRRWEAALNRITTRGEGLGFTTLRNGPRTYFVVSYLRRVDDDAKIVYSGILDWDWLVPSFSEVVDGRTQISITDRNGVVVFSDQISTIGARQRDRIRPAKSRNNFDVLVSVATPQTARSQSQVAFVLTLIGALGLISILVARRSEFVSVSSPLQSSAIEVSPADVAAAPSISSSPMYQPESPVEESAVNLRSLYDSLVVALVALRAENSKHETKNIRVIEDQLRRMKTELGVNVELADYDFVADDNEDASDIEEEVQMMAMSSKSPLPDLPEAPPEALEVDWDSDFVVRRPKVNEIEH